MRRFTEQSGHECQHNWVCMLVSACFVLNYGTGSPLFSEGLPDTLEASGIAVPIRSALRLSNPWPSFEGTGIRHGLALVQVTNNNIAPNSAAIHLVKELAACEIPTHIVEYQRNCVTLLKLASENERMSGHLRQTYLLIPVCAYPAI